MWGIIKINISPEGCHCCAVIVVMCDVVVSDCGSGDNDIVVVVGHCKIKHLKQIRYSPRGGGCYCGCHGRCRCRGSGEW